MQKPKLKGIYAITPSGLEEKILLRKITELLKVGIKVLQFRDKERDFTEKLIVAKQICRICERFKCTFIINDDPLLVKEVDADGVHLGQEDMSYEEARNILGPDSVIGISCQNNLDFALKAEAQGANYIAFGSLFNTEKGIQYSKGYSTQQRVFHTAKGNPYSKEYIKTLPFPEPKSNNVEDFTSIGR